MAKSQSLWNRAVSYDRIMLQRLTVKVSIPLEQGSVLRRLYLRNECI